ncbi:SusC/RagA family TonB-linked outer membrane protein [Maribacter chungangensis]|uniref:SusC/RagA family TonB-linked outer membrane protein n=1 Tax=Maribacter chungangensis TaxID=1069117 RepID=A0ABW3AZH2_9FLAO
MNRKIFGFLTLVALLLSQTILAQETTVSGTITDESGMPLPAVNVIEKGTTNGTSSDFDGNYSITVSNNAILVFSSLGFTSKEVATENRATINVSLTEDSQMLDEVVVTALGIKKERKALGYAVQEIKGGELLEARETNLVNAMSGKVSGLQVIRGSNGPASSSKIVLRGNNSLTGDNQPLIVVDGVPMDNFTGGNNESFFNPSADLGNGLGDINPDDIESMSVLKGASAAALYGSRAGNGVILITTKTGTTRKGLGITVSTSTGFQNVFMNPEFQNSFGQGDRGNYDVLATQSWGPQINGQTVQDWKGDLVTLRSHDNLRNFYNGGLTKNYGLSFQQQVSDGTSLYSSLNYLDDRGNIPNASFKRFNFTTRAVSNFGPNKRWTTDVKIQYTAANAQNRPLGGENINNVHRSIIGLPRTLNLNDFRNPVDEFGNMVWFLESNSVNPFWAAQNNLNQDSRDRFLLNGAIKYKLNDWITAELRGGADMYTNNAETKQFSGSPLSPNGRFSLSKDVFIEENYLAIVNGSKSDILGKLGFSFTAGAQLMQQRRDGISGNAGELEVPNLFSLNNGINQASVGQSFSQKKINSMFGSIGFDYDGILFMDVTGRNDWTSTLSPENRSFFYPSVNGSFVFSELLNTSAEGWFNFGKIRASYATVGNDLAPFQLLNVFSIGNDPNNNTTAGTNNTLNNPDLVNELIKSSEVGVEARFFNNRLSIDAAWYRTNSTNQLLAIPLDPLSGFNSQRVNAGDIQNEGFEITLNADVFRNPNGFSWNTNVNFARNRNTVEALIDDVSQFQLGGFDNLAVIAPVGGLYGEIWGTTFRRIEDEASPNFGKIVVDGDGLPLPSEGNVTSKLGNQQPDALIGWSNTFAYKNWSIGFLLDASLGGDIFSGTNRFLQRSGNAAVTVIDGGREDIVVDAVVDDGTGNFVANTTAVTPQDYWTALANRSGNLGIAEAFIYDATHVRLRNVSINYVLNSKWLKNTGIQSAKFGLSANNVWMIHSNLNGVDPESVFATRSNATGFENLSPPTVRSLFFNVSLSL